MFRRNFLCLSLCPLPLVLSLGTIHRKHTPFSSNVLEKKKYFEVLLIQEHVIKLNRIFMPKQDHKEWEYLGMQESILWIVKLGGR